MHGVGFSNLKIARYVPMERFATIVALSRPEKSLHFFVNSIAVKVSVEANTKIALHLV